MIPPTIRVSSEYQLLFEYAIGTDKHRNKNIMVMKHERIVSNLYIKSEANYLFHI